MTFLWEVKNNSIMFLKSWTLSQQLSVHDWELKSIEKILYLQLIKNCPTYIRIPSKFFKFPQWAVDASFTNSNSCKALSHWLAVWFTESTLYVVAASCFVMQLQTFLKANNHDKCYLLRSNKVYSTWKIIKNTCSFTEVYK